jgi:tRNA dimethylallyltransferase
MKNKLLIISGQTGVGKTDISYRLARNLNGEIILMDTIQQYKGLKITANKPSTFMTSAIKYHNIDEHELSPNSNLNASFYVQRTRQIINDVWNRGKLPILEGGSGFYFKMLLTGGSARFNQEEEIEFEKKIEIARKIILYDNNNFDKTFSRLLKLDQSFPQHVLLKNDFYRLEKRLAEALMFGNGAYEKVREMEETLRKENVFLENVSIYNFFLYMDKFELIKKLEQRCEKMIETGLIEEVSDLLYTNKIDEKIFLFNSQALFLNAYGLLETIKYFTDLLRYLDKKSIIINSFSDHISQKDPNVAANVKIFNELFYKYMISFSINNRQYAKRQAKWFKKNENFLWLNASLPQNKLIDIIKDKYLIMSKEEFEKETLSVVNKKIKEDYNYKDILFKTKSVFTILKSRQKMKMLLEKSFNAVEKNKTKLKNIANILKEQDNKSESESKINIAEIESILKNLNL